MFVSIHHQIHDQRHDASIMPRIPRANTHLPTMMIAERIAQDVMPTSEPVAAARSTP